MLEIKKCDQAKKGKKGKKERQLPIKTIPCTVARFFTEPWGQVQTKGTWSTQNGCNWLGLNVKIPRGIGICLN